MCVCHLSLCSAWSRPVIVKVMTVKHREAHSPCAQNDKSLASVCPVNLRKKTDRELLKYTFSCHFLPNYSPNIQDLILFLHQNLKSCFSSTCERVMILQVSCFSSVQCTEDWTCKTQTVCVPTKKKGKKGFILIAAGCKTDILATYGIPHL